MISCNSTEIQERERTSFNEDWLFQKSDDSSAFEKNYNDSSWRSLQLPHDWAIEGPFKPEYNLRTGGLPIFGKAWYSKHFNIDNQKKKALLLLEFDGIMNNSTIYVNGKKVYHRPYGYIGFEVDVTQYINFGEENLIAVEVNPEVLSARWYPGAGIYRNVWLEIKNPVHIKHWGTQITTPVVTEETAEVTIETKVKMSKNLKVIFRLKHLFTI